MIYRCKFYKNGVFNTFFPLSHTFYFETRPRPLSKIGENAFGAHFLQLYCKNEYGDPHFLFHDFNKDSASFRWEKNWHKSMFSFLAILLNCTDWAITGRIARVQFNSTLERKIETGALKGIFLVCKQGVHLASAIGEFSVYYAWFSGKRSVAYDYFIFRRGASFKIFSCNVTPFSCY